MANMHQFLKAMIEKGASDLHITTGTAPQLRIDGKLHPLKVPPLSAPETKQLCYSVLTDAQKHQFEENNELDLSFSVQRLSRFRANIFVQRGNIAGAFRAIPFKIKTFEELNLPKAVADLAERPRESPRRWRRSSTRSTPSATSTSSRSRTRSSTCTTTSPAW